MWRQKALNIFNMSVQTLSSGADKRAGKLFYINNIKVLMTVLVVLHHTVITYGGPGGWYYAEKTSRIGALIPMTMFVSINQSFFMGFFFLLSAFFTPASYERKGAEKFVKDRLLRLGLPLIFYSFIFSPLLSFLVYYFAKGNHITYLQYLSGFDSWIDFGVLWFVAALLLFTLVYVLYRRIARDSHKALLKVPGTVMILSFAVVLGVISFCVRLVFPVGWVLKPVGFQLGHFTQYIALFITGIVAYKNNWFEKLSSRTGKQLAVCAIVLLLFFPAFYVIKEKTDMPVSWFSGGLHWQSLLYAVWEQCMGISILTALLTAGRKYWNSSSLFLERLSGSAFAVYILHPLVIISLSLAVRNWTVDPAIKLLLVAPLAVLGSFILGMLFVLLPGIKRIL